MQYRYTPLQVKVWNSKCTQVKVQKYWHQIILSTKVKVLKCLKIADRQSHECGELVDRLFSNSLCIK